MFFGCNVGKRSRVHYSNCIYCKRSKNKKAFETLDEAFNEGAKPCKHCLAMDKHIKLENEKVCAFAKKFSLKVNTQTGLVYIKDGLDKWKLVPSSEGKIIYLFHKNNKECGEEEGNSYFLKHHKHKEEFSTIVGAMEYIADHLNKYLTMPNLPPKLKDRAKCIIYKDTKRYKKKENKARDSHTRYLKRCNKREAINNVYKLMEILDHKKYQPASGLENV